MNIVILIIVLSSNRIFVIAEKGKLTIPPTTKKQVQELKKKITRLEKPLIVRSPDLDGNGIVNMWDFAVLARYWLSIDEPERWLQRK